MPRKCETVNGRKQVVNHNRSAHDHFPLQSRGTCSTLSHTQKEYILRKYDSKTVRNLFVTSMLDNKGTTCSPEQRANQHQFKRAVYDFMTRNKKLLVGDDQLDVMTLDVINELLTLLKERTDLRMGEAPVGESDRPYYQYDYWKNYLWKYIHVVAITRSPTPHQSLVYCLSQLMHARGRLVWVGRSLVTKFNSKVQLSCC